LERNLSNVHSSEAAKAVSPICAANFFSSLLTGDSTLNVVAMNFVGVDASPKLRSEKKQSAHVYTAVNQHYLLPFHNMAILVGEGEQGGNYNATDVVRLGLPLTALVLVVTGAWKCRGGGSLALFRESRGKLRRAAV
jgi:hypothetical protein